jgi:hypothetical protein
MSLYFQDMGVYRDMFLGASGLKNWPASLYGYLCELERPSIARHERLSKNIQGRACMSSSVLVSRNFPEEQVCLSALPRASKIAWHIGMTGAFLKLRRFLT